MLQIEPELETKVEEGGHWRNGVWGVTLEVLCSFCAYIPNLTKHLVFLFYSLLSRTMVIAVRGLHWTNHTPDHSPSNFCLQFFVYPQLLPVYQLSAHTHTSLPAGRARLRTTPSCPPTHRDTKMLLILGLRNGSSHPINRLHTLLFR